MRALVQRVRRASVTIDGGVVASIEAGLLVYLAAAPADGPDEAAWTARKIAELRIFPADAAATSSGDASDAPPASDAASSDGRMDRSVEECGGAVLLVSQFTLYADTRRGRRPAFTDAAPPSIAAPLVEACAAALRARGLHVEQGRFAADMLVASENDGPVTIILDSIDRERPRRG